MTGFHYKDLTERTPAGINIIARPSAYEGKGILWIGALGKRFWAPEVTVILSCAYLIG